MPNFLGRRVGGKRAAHQPLRAVGVLVIALALAACAPRAVPPAGDPDRPVVLTTFTVLADIARNIAGEDLEVVSLTAIGAEIHGYEPTPDDLRRAEGAELILDNGLGLEAWFGRFLEHADAPHVTVSDGVATIPISRGDEEGHSNPHAWMSPSVGLAYVENIRAAFAALDPAHAGDYDRRAADYSAQLRDVVRDVTKALGALPPAQRALVTCEGAFSYLARDVGLDEAFLWPVNADALGTPQQVVRVVTFVRDRDVPAVFCESTVPHTAQREVARETGARFAGVLYVDSLSLPGGPVPTYLDLLRHDTSVIVNGLTGGRG